MIRAAEVKQLNAKLPGIMSSEELGLDYIKVLNDTWFYSPRTNEIFEFRDGMFTAHAKVVGQVDTFHIRSVIKKLPPDVQVVQVVEEANCIKLEATPRTAPLWQKITKQEDIEDWLLRQNKMHHQQVYKDGSPHVTGAIVKMFESFNDPKILHMYLEGEITASEVLCSPPAQSPEIEYEYLREWLESFQMTPKEKGLESVNDWVNPDELANIFKKANKNKSSSPSGLHYTIWKAATESETVCQYMSIMMSLPFKCHCPSSTDLQIIDGRERLMSCLRRYRGSGTCTFSGSLGLLKQTTTALSR